MKGRYLTVTVKSHIKQYLVESLGTDVVKTERNSTLLAIIKPHLILESAVEEVEEIPDDYEKIQIELPDLRQVYSAVNGKVYYCDTMFRDHIDQLGLEKVRNFFSRTFKAAFRTFMDGYTESQNDINSLSEENRRLRVKQGVVSFLLQYHIEPKEKLVINLTRDWYRHQHRNEKNRFSPITY